MKFTKAFILGYGLLYIMMNILKIPLVLLIETLSIPSNNLLAIPTFIINFFITIINILSFSTEYPLINIILWSFRAVVIAEIVIVIRG